MSAIRVCTSIILFCSFVTGPRAQRVIPLQVDDLLNARQFGSGSPVEFSPDGKWLAYGVVTPNKSGTRSASTTTGSALTSAIPSAYLNEDIFVATTSGGHEINITQGSGSNWGASWSPDGRNLAFISDRDEVGQPKLWVWDTRGHSLQKISDVRLRASEIQWLPDSSSLLVTVANEGLVGGRIENDRTETNSLEPQHSSTPGSSAMIYSSGTRGGRDNINPASDPWSLDSALRDLARVEVASGRVERIFEGQRISSYRTSPNGLLVAFTIPIRFERAGSQQILYDIRVLDLHTIGSRVVAHDVRLDFTGFAFSWSPDSSLLSYQVGGMDANGDLYIVNAAAAGASRNLTNFPTQQQNFIAWPPLWDERGQAIFFLNKGAVWMASVTEGNSKALSSASGRRVVTMLSRKHGMLWSPDGGNSTVVLTDDTQMKQSGFYRIDLRTGASTKLLEDGHCFACARQTKLAAISFDGKRIVYFSNDTQHDVDLWIASADFKDFRRVTDLNPQFNKYEMGRGELIHWRGLDGEPLSGALLLPAGYEKGKKYPLIVNVYGGSTRSELLRYFGCETGVQNMQLLATRGYAVLFPDAPQHLGTPLADLAKTVLPGVNKLIDMGIADPDRLGIMGHSYGGYSVLALIVQTKQFKAAIVSAGSADLIAEYGEMSRNGSAYGTAISESGQGLMGGVPWQMRDRYIENSPIFYLDRIETPVLLIHGGADKAVDPFLASEVFVGLRRLGKEAEFARYDGEDHSELTWSYANQEDYVKRLIDWFESHLKTPHN